MDYSTLWTSISPYIIAHCPWVIPLVAVLVAVGALFKGLASLRVDKPNGTAETTERLLEGAIKRLENETEALQQERKRSTALAEENDGLRRELSIADRWIEGR